MFPVNCHVIELKYNGTAEDGIKNTGIIQSPNFPEYYAESTAYVYYFNIKSTSWRYVQLVFTDLILESDSSLKVSRSSLSVLKSIIQNKENEPHGIELSHISFFLRRDNLNFNTCLCKTSSAICISQ